jgi:hypothetical protein
MACQSPRITLSLPVVWDCELHALLEVYYLHLQVGRESPVIKQQATCSTLYFEAVRSSETSVTFYQITWRHIPEAAKHCSFVIMVVPQINRLTFTQKRGSYFAYIIQITSRYRSRLSDTFFFQIVATGNSVDKNTLLLVSTPFSGFHESSGTGFISLK